MKKIYLLLLGLNPFVIGFVIVRFFVPTSSVVKIAKFDSNLVQSLPKETQSMILELLKSNAALSNDLISTINYVMVFAFTLCLLNLLVGYLLLSDRTKS